MDADEHRALAPSSPCIGTAEWFGSLPHGAGSEPRSPQPTEPGVGRWMPRESIAALISKVPVFSRVELSPSVAKNFALTLADNCVEQTFDPGETIFARGDVAEDMYFIVDGVVQIFVEMHILAVSELLPGDMFGEGALFVNAPRCVFAVAKAGESRANTRVLRLPTSALARVLPLYPTVECALAEFAMGRRAHSSRLVGAANWTRPMPSLPRTAAQLYELDMAECILDRVSSSYSLTRQVIKPSERADPPQPFRSLPLAEKQRYEDLARNDLYRFKQETAATGGRNALRMIQYCDPVILKPLALHLLAPLLGVLPFLVPMTGGRRSCKLGNAKLEGQYISTSIVECAVIDPVVFTFVVLPLWLLIAAFWFFEVMEVQFKHIGFTEREHDGTPADLSAGSETDETVALDVENTSDQLVEVGSHLPFFEASEALEFDRERAAGRRLSIPAGNSVRFEPGEKKTVRLEYLAGHDLSTHQEQESTSGLFAGSRKQKALIIIGSQATCALVLGVLVPTLTAKPVGGDIGSLKHPQTHEWVLNSWSVVVYIGVLLCAAWPVAVVVWRLIADTSHAQDAYAAKKAKAASALKQREETPAICHVSAVHGVVDSLIKHTLAAVPASSTPVVGDTKVDRSQTHEPKQLVEAVPHEGAILPPLARAHQRDKNAEHHAETVEQTAILVDRPAPQVRGVARPHIFPSLLRILDRGHVT